MGRVYQKYLKIIVIAIKEYALMTVLNNLYSFIYYMVS